MNTSRCRDECFESLKQILLNLAERQLIRWHYRSSEVTVPGFVPFEVTLKEGRQKVAFGNVMVCPGVSVNHNKY